jgi:hypothetical protein
MSSRHAHGLRPSNACTMHGSHSPWQCIGSLSCEIFRVLFAAMWPELDLVTGYHAQGKGKGVRIHVLVTGTGTCNGLPCAGEREGSMYIHYVVTELEPVMRSLTWILLFILIWTMIIRISTVIWMPILIQNIYNSNQNITCNLNM